MFSVQSKKTVAALLWLLIFSSAVLVQSCKKTDAVSPTENLPDLTTKIASSVSGFVTDNADVAVEGATVQFGGSTAASDKYGYFTFSNVQVVKNAAVVTVTKPGYFNGIKTYIASEGHNGFFRIKLLPKTNQGNFDAATGGTIALANGLSILFPANSIVVASSGAVYTGPVKVATILLDPTANDLHKTMPGDLRGLDNAGRMKILTSFGMVATELTGNSDELLQIAPGKKATISFPIPPSIISYAASSIPLWYFDEQNGLWKEEGVAVKSGNNYTGEVSHFSWWNWDLPGGSIPLSFTLADATGYPVGNTFITINEANSAFQASGYTDSEGYVSGLAAPNKSYILKVYGGCSVNSPVFTYNFTTGPGNTELGNIVIPGSSLATVTGTVECGGLPLADAYIVFNKGGYVSRYPVNANGSYSFITPICGNNTPVLLSAENLATNQSGSTVAVALNSGINNIPVLQGCTIERTEFIEYTIDGVAYSLQQNSDTISTTFLYRVTGRGYGGTSYYHTCSFHMSLGGIGTNNNLNNFGANQIPENSSVSSSTTGGVGSSFVPINITEYGAIGEYIAGTFSCFVYSTSAPNNNFYQVTCNFRVKRTE